MKHFTSARLVPLKVVVALATCAPPGLALANDELRALREQLEAQKAQGADPECPGPLLTIVK